MKERIKLFLKKVPLILLALFSILINTNNVKADNIRISQNYVSGFFHAHKSGNSYSRYGQMAFWSTSNQDVSFCIEPGATFSSSTSYVTYSQNDYDLINIINNNTSNSANRITQEQLDKIKLYAFYGYGYDGHNTSEYRIATQMLIWRVVDPDQVFTDSNCTVNDCRAISDAEAGVADEMAEIQRLVGSHYLLPSFDRDKINLNLGESTTLYDSNNMLSNYQVSSCINCNAMINGNSLIITATGTGDLTVSLSKKTNSYGKSMLFAVASNSQNQVVIGDIDPVLSSVFGTVSGGSLEITKTDDTGKRLSGATFKVYNSNNLEVCTIITDSNGFGNCSNLSLGNYTIREVSTPNGYVLDDTIYSFSITSTNSNVELNFENLLIRGNVELYKVSESEDTDAKLDGAVYGIYDLSNNLIAEMTVNSDGYAKYENLKYGDYYIKEISPSIGHEVDQNIYHFSISNNGETIEIVSTEPVIKHKFNLIKTKGDGSSGVVETEANATFDIYLLSTNEKVDTIKTDKNGKANITLAYGIYNVCQKSGDNDTLLAECFTIDLRNNDVEKVVNNEYIKAKVKVVKIDSDTKQQVGISGIKFKIKNLDTNEYVCIVTDKKQCVFETDSNGVLITSLSIQAGHYQLEEVDQFINGYLWNKEPLDFFITYNDIVYDELLGAIVEVEFKNQPVKGVIEINKRGEQLVIENNKYSYIEVPLENITFGLYDENGNLITTIVTDQNGYAKIENLNLGKYILKELSTDENHVLDTQQYEINLQYQDQYTPVVLVELNLKNYMKKATLKFTKVDLITGELLPNTTIRIYDQDRNVIIYEGLTDENGKITIPDLYVGNFRIEEVQAPTGYELNIEPLYFSVSDNEDEIELSMTNEKIVVEVPKTYINDNIFYIISGLLIIFGVGVSAYAFKKKQK